MPIINYVGYPNYQLLVSHMNFVFFFSQSILCARFFDRLHFFRATLISCSAPIFLIDIATNINIKVPYFAILVYIMCQIFK